MNRLFLLALLAVFSLENGFAQTVQPTKRLQLGLIGGKTILGAYQEKIFLIKSSGGFAGIDLGYDFLKQNPNFSVRLQPNWEVFRQEIEAIFDMVSYAEFSSLNVPVLLRYSVPVRPWVRPFLEVGAAYKFKLKYSRELREKLCGFAGCTGTELLFASSQLVSGNRSGATVSLGIGAEFRWGAVNIPVSVRLNEGIGTYRMQGENVRGDQFDYANSEVRTLQLVTGVSF